MNMMNMKVPFSMKGMTMPSYLKVDNMAVWELVLFFVFIVYLIFPYYLPEFIANYIDSPMGYIIMLLITIVLFVYSHPLLAVLFIFVAYELLRRSSESASRVAIIKYTPSEKKRAETMAEMNPPKHTTLEEEMVHKMAPVGKSDPIVYNNSSFLPVAEKVEGASVFM